MLTTRRLVSVAVLLSTGLLLAGCGSSAPDPALDDFLIDSFSGEYRLGLDAEGHSTLAVRERIVVEFSDEDVNRGLVREIPDEYLGIPLSTAVVGVTDSAGAPVPFETSRSGADVVVDIGTDEFVHGTTQYVIDYTQRDVIMSFPATGTEEFYWNVNGTGWSQSIDRVSATVRLDPSLEEARTGDEYCYAGDQYATRECTIETISEGTVFSKTDRLLPGETLTVAIGFVPGTVVPGADPHTAWWVTLLPIGLMFVVVGGIVLLGILRRVVWPDARGRGIVVAQYEPPDGVDVHAASDLTGAGSTAFAATVIDLAVRRKVRLHDRTPGQEDGAKQGTSRRVVALEVLDPTGLSFAENEILTALLGEDPVPGAETVLGKVEKSVDERIKKVGATAENRAVEAGYRVPPAKPLARPIQWLEFALCLGSIALFIVAAVRGVTTGWTIAALIVGTVGLFALLVVSVKPARLTREGAELREHLDGLRLYIKLAEADRLAMLQSPDGAERREGDVVRIYERLLPYAVLWGMEKEWSKALELHYERAGEVPDWIDAALGDPVILELTANALGALAGMALGSTAAHAGGVIGSLVGGAIGIGIAGAGGGGGGGGGR